MESSTRKVDVLSLQLNMLKKLHKPHMGIEANHQLGLKGASFIRNERTAQRSSEV